MTIMICSGVKMNNVSLLIIVAYKYKAGEI